MKKCLIFIISMLCIFVSFGCNKEKVDCGVNAPESINFEKVNYIMADDVKIEYEVYPETADDSVIFSTNNPDILEMTIMEV